MASVEGANPGRRIQARDPRRPADRTIVPADETRSGEPTNPGDPRPVLGEPNSLVEGSGCPDRPGESLDRHRGRSFTLSRVTARTA